MKAPIELNPEYVKGYCRKAAALEFLNHFEEAKTTYLEGLKHDPGKAQLEEGVRKIRVQDGREESHEPFKNLERDRRTAGLLSDPSCRELILELCNKSSKLAVKLKVTRDFGVLLGGYLAGGPDEEEPIILPVPPPKKEPKPESKEEDLSENEEAVKENKLGTEAFQK